MANKGTVLDRLLSKCKDSLNREPIDATQQEIGYSKALNHIIVLLEEFKQMEKEQIIDAFIDGEHQQGFELEAEQYYNETYGKE